MSKKRVAFSASRYPETAQFIPSNKTEIASALLRNDKWGNGKDFFFREKRYTTYYIRHTVLKCFL